MSHPPINIHERRIDAPPSVLGPLLDGLGGPDDRLWPSPAWVPMVLDQPLAVGADGGHGPIRYRVVDYEPGRRVRFEFHSTPGVSGHHELVVSPDGDGSLVRHILTARSPWPLGLILGETLMHLHDACVEDMLDNAERAATGTVRAPSRWSPRVRALRALSDRPAARAVPVPVPESAILARRTIDEWSAAARRGRLVDAHAVELRRGMSTDPRAWAKDAFGGAPAAVRAAMALREAVVGLVGIGRGSPGSFAIRDSTGDEVLLGEDASHLDFRASVLVADGAVTLTTVAVPHNLRGRLYLLPVRIAHPIIVEAILRATWRRMQVDVEALAPT
ncbi:DUF2867 domain-containing protein [Tsukamurella sp. 8F]|uniref:DUF2867 domain-containing protein n=1 Tax=unclassified Tsukamurella TaxID=2633480 RepID=UPI0023B958A0|nr:MULTISPECIES: DUF2867 domain-containing protein [unclassified Tsukamurella]MDF0530722.1 DUF2867 domain-containing protein [Tsukamurella sp. 8J]MDF0587923.1 DUF2867 domain-containing protein [Tsukamurella sp. 8F]